VDRRAASEGRQGGGLTSGCLICSMGRRRLTLGGGDNESRGFG
jgi:hypothetical protein